MVVTLSSPPTPVWQRVAMWLLSGVVLTGLAVLFADQPISTWSHDVLHRPRLAVDVQKVAGALYLGGGALLVLLVALVTKLSRHALGPIWRIAIAAAGATVLATFAVTLFKFGFGRLWPETWTHNNLSWISNHAYGFFPFHGGEGYESFPSGHTARTAAPCTVLWYRVPHVRVLWVLPTVIIAAALLAADFHFLSDCIAGAYLGVACAAVILRYYRP